KLHQNKIIPSLRNYNLFFKTTNLNEVKDELGNISKTPQEERIRKIRLI
ncbi:MAG: hypothetical protein ACI8VT_003916, partial [Saprospiraceae bacterium]